MADHRSVSRRAPTVGAPPILTPLERGAAGLLCLVVTVALVPFGSTGDIAMPLALLCAASWCAMATLVCCRSWPSAARIAIFIAVALGGYMLLQASTLPVLPPASAFAEASRLLGRSLPATSSIAPGHTIEAIAPVIVPLLVFAVACRLLRTDRSAQGVLRFLSLLGAGIASFGILQHQLAPDAVLLSVKTSYRDDLTAVFINRNTAATFLGGTLLIALSVVAYEIGRRPTLSTLLSVSMHRRDRGIVLHGSAALIALVALAMTSSRAGGAATLIATTLLVALLYRRREDAGRQLRTRRTRTLFLQRWAVAFAVCSLIAVLVGSRMLDRVVTQGVEDARFCVYPDIWRLATTVWPWGTGAGTFELAFRPFRDPACGVHGVWDRAHSFFLEGLVVLGVPFCVAALAALWTLGATLRRGWRERRQFRSGPALGLSIAALLVLHDLVDFSIQIPGIALWAAVVLAAACALCDRKQTSTGPSFSSE